MGKNQERKHHTWIFILPLLVIPLSIWSFIDQKSSQNKNKDVLEGIKKNGDQIKTGQDDISARQKQSDDTMEKLLLAVANATNLPTSLRQQVIDAQNFNYSIGTNITSMDEMTRAYTHKVAKQKLQNEQDFEEHKRVLEEQLNKRWTNAVQVFESANRSLERILTTVAFRQSMELSGHIGPVPFAPSTDTPIGSLKIGTNSDLVFSVTVESTDSPTLRMYSGNISLFIMSKNDYVFPTLQDGTVSTAYDECPRTNCTPCIEAAISDFIGAKNAQIKGKK